MIYVMSDIHGNLRRFDSIMSQINLNKDDTLYILGDVIDRFPDGIRILRQLMKMTNAKMLIGNHELMMLNSLDIGLPYEQMDCIQKAQNKSALRLWYQNGGWVTHNYLKHIRKVLRKEIFSYLQQLPLYYDVEVNEMKYRLVHAAPIDRFDDWGCRYTDCREYAVWHRIPESEELTEIYTLIYGHTPTIYYQENNPTEIWYGQNRICIDCGAGYNMVYGNQSRLACLRLDDYREFYSEE